MPRLRDLVASLLLTLPVLVQAIGHAPCVAFSKGSSFTFPLVSNGQAATILTSADEWPGVNQLAVPNFASDVAKVTGHTPSHQNVSSLSALKSSSGVTVIVGTVDHSSLISSLANSSSVLANITATLRGQWEAYTALPLNLKGVGDAYVIVGSDKRGTIYGLYELSEQIGVSPWYWWADVPIVKHSSLFLSTCTNGPPDVKYRGIFINDEQPALQNWAQEKFTTNSTAPPFNHFFYGHLFELITRLRGNYLWPAMWSGMFYVDDGSLNGELADKYGVVLGTSHQEPMARSTPNEWNAANPPLGQWNFTINSANLTEWWTESVERAKDWETVYTIGMRGTGDLPLSVDTNVANLEEIVNAQRQIFANVFNTSDVTTVPQVWCLYKEVAGYYAAGMQVPDDVILLWTDDNWGNVLRYPLVSERNRTGGAGIYYHFDYVGNPVDYKWIPSAQISKSYDQLSMAIERNARALWIGNVGDLKPNELNTEFFLTMAYDSSRFSVSNLDAWVAKWAAREFGLSGSQSASVADIVANYTRYNARRKPEMLNTTLYSLINYREADTMLADWKTTYEASLKIYNALPSGTKPAFFQLVHHPVQASYQLHNLYVAAGKNNLYASQGRQSTNDLADQALEWFDEDYNLEVQYHTMLDGKWDHIMDQTHIGYYYWQQPMQNTMPAVNRLPPKKQALPGAMRLTIEGSLGAWPGDNPHQCALGYNCPPPTLSPLDPYLPFGSRYIDVSSGGPSTFKFTATSNASWLHINPSSGTISSLHKEQRLEVSADWSKVGSQSAIAQITLTSTDPSKKQPSVSQAILVPANPASAPAGFKGSVEGDGGVSIEASQFSKITPTTSGGNGTWVVLPGYGRTLDGITIKPSDGSVSYAVGSGPKLDYNFYNFNSKGGNVSITTYLSTSMNANGNAHNLSFALQVDGETPQTLSPIPNNNAGSLPAGWDGLDGPEANSVVTTHTNHTASPGAHTLTVWGIEPAIIVQKIVIDTGNVRSSYLGPPPSIRL